MKKVIDKDGKLQNAIDFTTMDAETKSFLIEIICMTLHELTNDPVKNLTDIRLGINAIGAINCADEKPDIAGATIIMVASKRFFELYEKHC